MSPKSLPRAEDFMTRGVQTVTPEMTLAEAVAFLTRHKVSNAPVVEKLEGGRPLLVGFLSEGDCLEYLSNEMFHGDPSPPQTVATMMKRHPICVTPDTDVFTLASILVSHRYRHLPVVEDGWLMGMVSRRDILQALASYYQDSASRHDLEKFPVNLREVMNLRFVSKSR